MELCYEFKLLAQSLSFPKGISQMVFYKCCAMRIPFGKLVLNLFQDDKVAVNLFR